MALQSVVHQLGRVEELLAPVDHLPLALQAHVAHERHERVEDLRDPAAEGGRRDVHHALALQRLGQLADLLDQLTPADVGVVGERLVSCGDGLEHGRTARYLAGRRARACDGRGAMRGQRPGRGLRSASMFDGRIYRVAFVPLLFVLVIVGFSLCRPSRPVALDARARRVRRRSARSPNCRALARRFPDRRPGSAGDDELAAYIAQC